MSINKLATAIANGAVQRIAVLALEPRPATGWARVIREALGMTRDQLARRIGLRGSSVATLERSEAAGTITLESLDRLARGMGCKVVYAIVPADGGSLEEIVRRRAVDVAAERLSRVTHTMALEDQAVDRRQQRQQLDRTVASLLAGSRRYLWR